jgi:positive regulator of sigma E activity
MKALRTAGAAGLLYELPLVLFLMAMLLVAAFNGARTGSWVVVAISGIFVAFGIRRVRHDVRAIRRAWRDQVDGLAG